MKFFKRAIIIFACFLFTNYAVGQDVQWASELQFQFNAYASNGDWSGEQLLGPPDALPLGELNKNAFRLSSMEEYGTITVGFQKAIHVEQILIVESNDPGRIVKVQLFDENDVPYEVYKTNANPIPNPYHIREIKIEKTNYSIKKLTLHLNSFGASGWPQIDAIGIAERAVDPGSIIEGASNDNIVAVDVESTVFQERKKMPKEVNSAADDLKPIISPDGKKLYFHRQMYPMNTGGKKDPQDIFVSEFVGGKWRNAQNLPRPLNDEGSNGICSVSPDGNTVYLLNAYNEDGSISRGVSIAYKTNDGWSDPKKLTIRNYGNKSHYEDYFVSNSGNVMILAIEMDDSFGGQDLYVSFLQEEDVWSTPINLGLTLNTSGEEFSPFLASDNRTLYFASNGHEGMGGSDIFYTKRMSDNWLIWSKPVNLGESINTEDWDSYYSISARGDLAYFVSNSEGDDKSKVSNIYSVSLTKEYKPEAVVLLTGVVYDASTKLPIDAKVSYRSTPEGKETGTVNTLISDGSYKVVMPAELNYNIFAEAKGYISFAETQNFSYIREYKEIEHDIYLAPIAIGQKIQLNNLQFVQSKAEFLPESYPVLEDFYNQLIENPGLRVEISGHTDNQGNFNANMDLSRQRANVVMQYLIKKGIDKKRLSAKGYGPTRPIASNNNPETRVLNRRVEIEILSY